MSDRRSFQRRSPSELDARVITLVADVTNRRKPVLEHRPCINRPLYRPFRARVEQRREVVVVRITLVLRVHA